MRFPATLLLLACAAVSMAGCAGSALSASDPRAIDPAAAVTTASPRPVPSPSPQPVRPDPAVLARHASAYIASVTAAEQLYGDAALPPHVCSATFSELEFTAGLADDYQAEPALAGFISATGSVAWACELGRVGAMRQAVRGLARLEASLDALGSYGARPADPG